MGVVKIREQASWERAVEKQVSREIDAYLVEEGLSSIIDRAVSNDYFASLNLTGFKISAIGGRAIFKS